MTSSMDFLAVCGNTCGIRDVPIAFVVLKLVPEVYGKFKALAVSGMFQ